MAASTPLWFHGQIARAAAEARLRSEATKYAPGTVVYLVRKSSSRPRDFVITAHSVGSDATVNLIVECISLPTGTQYKLENKTDPQPAFVGMQELLDHYKRPNAALAIGPLIAFVPSPDALDDELPSQSGSARQQPAEEEEGMLRCEGYLVKLRGMGKNRTRFFQRTTKRFSYFSEDAGELIYSCDLSEIITVSDVSKKQFRVITQRPFGSGASASAETLLEAPNPRIKAKWLQAFQAKENLSGGIRDQPGELYREGYLTKVQTGLDSSKTRYFVLTDRAFGYYQEEAGELMGSTLLSNITTVQASGSSKDMKVISSQRFTVTGAFEVLCRAESVGVRNKWLSQMQKVLPSQVFQQ